MKFLAAPRASLTLPSCSPNYPRASRIGWTHARHCPFLNFADTGKSPQSNGINHTCTRAKGSNLSIIILEVSSGVCCVRSFYFLSVLFFFGGGQSNDYLVFQSSKVYSIYRPVCLARTLRYSPRQNYTVSNNRRNFGLTHKRLRCTYHLVLLRPKEIEKNGKMTLLDKRHTDIHICDDNATWQNGKIFTFSDYFNRFSIGETSV